MSDDVKKCIISGTLRYSNWEKIENAVVIVYMREFNVECNCKLVEVGYTTTDENGDFMFIINVKKYKKVDYIIKVYEPLTKI